jgi:hypothetical protein
VLRRLALAAYESRRLYGLILITRGIDEIPGPRRKIGSDLFGVAGRDIFLQSFQESEDLHGGRYLAYPEVCAGLQFFEVSLDAKPWMLHEIRG